MGLPVNLPAITDVDHKHGHTFILDPNDDSEIANAIAPEAIRLTLERFADPSRIFRHGDSLVKKRQNPDPIAFCEFA
jgi:hypothetical protein